MLRLLSCGYLYIKFEVITLVRTAPLGQHVGVLHDFLISSVHGRHERPSTTVFENTTRVTQNKRMKFMSVIWSFSLASGEAIWRLDAWGRRILCLTRNRDEETVRWRHNLMKTMTCFIILDKRKWEVRQWNRRPPHLRFNPFPLSVSGMVSGSQKHHKNMLLWLLLNSFGYLIGVFQSGHIATWQGTKIWPFVFWSRDISLLKLSKL